jgi:hypothetical protein
VRAAGSWTRPEMMAAAWAGVIKRSKRVKRGKG